MFEMGCDFALAVLTLVLRNAFPGPSHVRSARFGKDDFGACCR